MFEDSIEKVLTQYSHQGVMLLKKVEPPTRTIGAGKFRRVIYLENPFLDFIGAWAEHGGRMVSMEAKWTERPKLYLNDSGLKEHQVTAMRSWWSYQAVTFALWGHRHEVRYVSLDLVRKTQETGQAFIPWDEAETIPKGKGFILFDFRINMLAHHGPVNGARRD